MERMRETHKNNYWRYIYDRIINYQKGQGAVYAS